jgi:heptosyltransferase II
LNNKNNSKRIKALIELPTWMGDCVMSTPAIENIIKHYDNIEITFIGSYTSTEIIKNHPKAVKVIVLDREIKSFFYTYSRIGVFDVFFSFRSSIRSKILQLFIKSNEFYQFNKTKYQNRHQVQKYVDFINDCLETTFLPGLLSLHSKKDIKNKSNKLLGINPGASYGSAKRWYPDKFAKVAIELSKNFDIIIFGGNDEIRFAKQIERILINNNIKNYRNLAGVTSVDSLINHISNLDIFITGDSGPMHLAASFQIPTIAIFGPTNDLETAQWMNPKNIIIKKNLECQPCMKRTCPLKHHNCMKKINSQEVIDSATILI